MKVVLRLFSVFFVLIAFSFTSIAYAKIPVAVLNVQALWEKSSAAESARAQIKVKDDAFAAELKKKDEELKKEDEELTKKRSVLSAEAYETARKAFREKQISISTALEKKREGLKKSINQATDPIRAAIVDIVATIAKQKEIDVVLDRAQAVYASSSLDITAEVLTTLNQKLPKITVDFKEPEAPAKK